MTSPLNNLVNLERYRAADAARLLGVPPSRVQRWLRGRVSKAASFYDLVELHLIQDLYTRGFDPRRLRRLLAEDRRLTEHPLASRSYLVHGSTLYRVLADCAVELGTGGQLGIQDLVTQRAETIDFAEDRAEQWWPHGRGVPVRVNPSIGWGLPTLEGTGTSTAVIAAMWKAEGGDTARVADWYELPPDKVQAAVDFEKQLRAA